MRRRRLTGALARRSSKERLEVGDRSAAGDLEHRPDQHPDHVAHEGVGLDPELEQPPKRLRRARRATRRAGSSRSKRTCSVSVGVKAVKSCVPTSSGGAALERGRRSSGCGHQSARPLLERVANRRRRGPGSNRCASGRRARASKPSGAGSAASTAISRGSSALSRRRSASGQLARRCSKLATWPQAWTPASVRPATVSRGRLAEDPLQRRLELALDGALARAGRPSRRTACRRRRSSSRSVRHEPAPTRR